MLKQQFIGIILLTACFACPSLGQGNNEYEFDQVEFVSEMPTASPGVEYVAIADILNGSVGLTGNTAGSVPSVEASPLNSEALQSYEPIDYVASNFEPSGYPAAEGPISYEPMPMPMGMDGQGDFEFIQSSTDGEYLQVPSYELPTVKFTFDGVLLNRVGGDPDQTLVRQSVGGPPAITSGDIGFENRLGGRVELMFYSAPYRFAPRASILWTGTELSKMDYMAPEGSTADVTFFQGRAADPSPGYTLRNRSRFTFADIGLRRTVSPAYGFSAGLAYARLVESMDWVSRGEDLQDPSGGGGGGGSGDVETGFFSQVDNRMYGVNVGADVQLWTNGYAKLDGNVSFGIFYNDVDAGAQALNYEQEWEPSDTAYIGMANLALVIPADLVNFRIGYQGAFVSGVALPGSYTRDLSIFDGSGEIPSDDIWYHGLTFGIEILR